MSYNNETGMYEGYIYCITNKVNGKKYIGQTTVTINHRMGQHFSNKKENTAINNAIRKYGKDAFETTEIEKVISESKKLLVNTLNEKEIFYISKYESLVTQNGYNISRGGNRCEQRGIKIDVYKKDGTFIDTVDTVTGAALRFGSKSSTILNICNGKTNIGENHDYIFRYAGDPFDKFDTTFTNTRSRKVYQFTPEGEFVAEYPSTADAEYKMRGKKGCIIAGSIRLKQKAYGYVWSYENKFDYTPPKNNSCWVPVDQYSLSGEFLNSYDSMRLAADAVGGKAGIVQKACSGTNRTAYGYVWRRRCDSFDKYPLKIHPKTWKKINQYTMDDTYLKTFESVEEVERFNQNRNYKYVRQCCKKERLSYKGYKWFYANDPDQPDKSRIATD